MGAVQCTAVQYCAVLCTAVDRIVKYSTVQCKGAGVRCSAAWRVIERPPGKNFQLCSRSPGPVVQSSHGHNQEYNSFSKA